MRRCHVLPVAVVFHRVHHNADAGFAEVVQQLLCQKNVFTRSQFNCFENPNTQQRKLVQNLCTRRAGDVPDMSAKSTPKPAIFVNRSGGGDGTWSDHR